MTEPLEGADWAARADEGRRLAPSAGEPAADAALLALLLDATDSAVSRRTAEAPARTGSPAAARLLTEALALADAALGDWIATGADDGSEPAPTG
ncbi:MULTISPECIES: hypothetical protein [Streptomyces]|uniref:Uncharacterized protein n=1 Tax=Streptomyces evansiae TaxID=3075535 RepID=A0ABU2QUP9_9ACTN|nr:MULTISPECIES: hypothetical protein [unclassified Streptomyces]MDT0408176.1 hypothetical protein [Streptomyces sp. DSM 41979]MYQ58628.1 hypothetical protein [Streptomyces sp. SID4926]SCD47886.1 hypothetical protein GA0115252_107319 [Streptomyces sp. DfronAA-171]